MGWVEKNLLITGLPGVGKTTLIRRLFEALKDFHLVGFYTAEIREGGMRKGFEIVRCYEGWRKRLKDRLKLTFHESRY